MATPPGASRGTKLSGKATAKVMATATAPGDETTRRDEGPAGRAKRSTPIAAKPATGSHAW